MRAKVNSHLLPFSLLVKFVICNVLMILFSYCNWILYLFLVFPCLMIWVFLLCVRIWDCSSISWAALGYLFDLAQHFSFCFTSVVFGFHYLWSLAWNIFSHETKMTKVRIYIQFVLWSVKGTINVQKCGRTRLNFLNYVLVAIFF